MAEWSRVVNTTTSKYFREEEVNVLRNRKLTAYLEQRGRITFNHSGKDMDWKIRYKQAPMQGYADEDTLEFVKRDRHKTATLEWRGYASTDRVPKKERLMNKGPEAIISIFDEIATWLLDDVSEQFCEELYVDGNAAGNEKKIHGIESFMGNSGAASTGYIGTPSDTFAGLSTVLGNYGGTWTGDWPAGRGDAHYDFNSPIIVDYTDTAWTASTDTWANTAVEALRYGIIMSQRSKSKQGMLDMILYNSEMHRQFMDLLDDKERILVERNAAASPLVALGFRDVINYDGVDVTWEYGMPGTVSGTDVGVGYGFNADQMELRSLQSQLFVPDGPYWDESSRSWKFAADMFGNCAWNPRYFVKWMKIT